VLFAYNSVICIVVICANFVLLGLLHTFRFSTDRELNGRATAQFETLIFPVLTGQSKDQDSCDQAVLPAEWPALDRNSIIALFLLYRHRKRRRNRLHWAHPVIQKREDSVPLINYLMEYEMTKRSFSIISECQFHLSTSCIADWRRVFSVVTVKLGTAFNL